MSISFAALIAAEVSFMRMFGLGLTLAVLADATLVRMVLMPAFMHVMGAWNWWAPKWLTRIHDRLALGHGDGAGTIDHSNPAAATKDAHQLQSPLNAKDSDVVSTMRRVP
jgi:RND superfamily putative drug exporter